MEADQEVLLPSIERLQGSTNNQFRYNGISASKSLRKNLLLLIVSIFIASSLTIYLYLNLVAINGNQSDQARYKPLSRRKPILDHESIFSDSGPSMIRLNDLLAHCIVALQIAGQEVVNLSSSKKLDSNPIGSKGKTLEGVEDIVTGADIKSHLMIVSTIKDSYRRLNVVSEEDTTKVFESIRLEDDILPIKRVDFARMLRQNLHDIEHQHEDRNSLIDQHETLVWIDPLDATKEYSESLTEFVTLMACIVHKSLPVAGIIHKPFSNQTFWSLRDDKTGTIQHSSDLTKLLTTKKSPRPDDDNMHVIVSRSHAGDVKDILNRHYGDKIRVETAGGSGFKTIELLSGSVDAYVHITQIKKWDICAPHAILHSIHSGNLTNLGGGRIEFGDSKDKVVSDGLVATVDKAIHDNLVKSLMNVIGEK